MNTFIDVLVERMEEGFSGHNETIRMTQSDYDLILSVQEKIQKVLLPEDEFSHDSLTFMYRMLNAASPSGKGRNRKEDFQKLLEEPEHHNMLKDIVEYLNIAIKKSSIDSFRITIITQDSEEGTIFTGTEEECQNKLRQLQSIIPECDLCCQEI